MDHADTPTAPAPHRISGCYVWWCASCGRSETFGDDGLERSAREGWPACCGRAVNSHYLGRRCFGEFASPAA
jgi:hypothetical protein